MRPYSNTPYRDTVASALHPIMDTREKLRRARKALRFAIGLAAFWWLAALWLIARLGAAGGTLW